MSELNDEFVKRGFWVNRAEGPVMGKTITTDARTGTVIVALLTILASVATAQLWNLVSFLYHQARATGIPLDGLSWQQQALLRTLPTPPSMMADLLKLWWTWRRKASHAFFRSVVPFSTALFFAIASLATSLSTSYVVSTSDLEVLVNSPFCGALNWTALVEDPSLTTALWTNIQPGVKNYARQCYGYKTGASLPAFCNKVFLQPNISFRMDPAPCPWNSSMCLPGASPAIAMDTGLRDASYFGFNLQQTNSVKFRKKTTCNVLPLEGRFVFGNMSLWANRTLGKAVDPNQKAVGLQLGTQGNFTTYMRPNDTFAHPDTPINQFDVDGQIGYLNARPGAWYLTPLEEMRRSDADVGLSAVWYNSIEFQSAVDDPLFKALTPRNFTYASNNYSVWHAEQPAGAVGCALQYQFCIPQKGKDDLCTPLSGLPYVNFTKLLPVANEMQVTLLNLFRVTAILNDQGSAAVSSVLQANDMLLQGEISVLPSDQWIHEVVGWEAYVWSGIQAMLTEPVTGLLNRDSTADKFTQEPQTAADKQLCKSIKMRKAGGYANINVFGLVIVITFTSVITVFNMTVLRFFIFLSKFRQALAPRVDRWTQDGVFQLQRRAFEAHGKGIWMNLDHEIPCPCENELLSELPLPSLPFKLRSDRPSFSEKPFKGLKRMETFHSEAETLNQADANWSGTLRRMDSSECAWRLARHKTRDMEYEKSPYSSTLNTSFAGLRSKETLFSSAGTPNPSETNVVKALERANTTKSPRRLTKHKKPAMNDTML